MCFSSKMSALIQGEAFVESLCEISPAGWPWAQEKWYMLTLLWFMKPEKAVAVPQRHWWWKPSESKKRQEKTMVSKTRSWNAHYCLIHIVLYLKIIPRVFQVETNPKSYRDALYLAFSSWVLYQTPDSFRHRTKMGALLLLIKFLSEFLTVFVLDMGAGSFWNSSCP